MENLSKDRAPNSREDLIPSHMYNDTSSQSQPHQINPPQCTPTPHQPQKPSILDNIIVGYAFGPKKMETMGLIMAEASKALSTVITSSPCGDSPSLSVIHHEQNTYYFPDDCDDEDARSARSFSSTKASSIASQRSLRLSSSGIQLTFLPEGGGLIPWVRSVDCDLSADSSMVTAATTMATGMSCGTPMGGRRKSLDGNGLASPSSPQSLRKDTNSGMRRHPIRVSFVPIDLDTPLQEQHGGKFDVILHKMTEDILCISKILRSKHQQKYYKADRIDEAIQLLDSTNDEDEIMTTESSSTNMNMLSRHQERAARRIQRLREYKLKSHPSCVLVDSPINILAVMSRADMAEVLSSCLEGVRTKGGVSVSTPRFRVVEEGEEGSVDSLANEMDEAGFCYPLIAKPLTAAGTKSSHHMGIVMARDGLQRLKTPCLLQEYANHGGQLFKVYVLGESVWVFSRESLPNLPPGENELPSLDETDKNRATKSYVEFQRPAGSRCYVEFNSQRPYPTLSDFGISGDTPSSVQRRTHATDGQWEPKTKKPRLNPTSPDEIIEQTSEINNNHVPDLASYVTKEEIEPVTNTLRAAFGLDLFGFDVLVKHIQKNEGGSNTKNNLDVKEILVVDVNYFPGYKEVPHFPSLLAQYLTQKAVETRMNVS